MEAHCPFCNKKAELCIILQHCCPKQFIPCENEECEETMRREKQENNEICPRTFINCNHCNVKVTRENTKKHMEAECPKRQIKCPLGCQSVFFFGKLLEN